MYYIVIDRKKEVNTRQYRAKIPYEVARFVADIVKENLARYVK
jgi:ribose 5-phosphate isomerase